MNQLTDQKEGPPRRKKIFNFFSPGWARVGRTLIGRCLQKNDQSTSSSSSSSSFDDDKGQESEMDENGDIIYFKKYLQNFHPASHQQFFDNQPDQEEEDDDDRWLIFPFGSKTYMQHEVCFKKLKLSKMAAILNAPDAHNDEEDENGIDEVDKRFEFNGHVVGLALSTDDQFLYVHCRHWSSGYEPPSLHQSTPISHGSDLHVIHMPTLTRIGMTHRHHTGHFTDMGANIYIYVGASQFLLGTGSNGYGGPGVVRDKNAYLWDQHYGLNLTQLPHEGHVSSIAFQPGQKSPDTAVQGHHHDNEKCGMLVSVSHDKRIRIWRSRLECRRLKIDMTTLKEAKKMFPRD